MSDDNRTTICQHDNAPCYVGGGTDDAHWRCGTSACGEAVNRTTTAEPPRYAYGESGKVALINRPICTHCGGRIYISNGCCSQCGRVTILPEDAR